MDAEELIENLKKSICSGLEVEPRTVNKFMIHTGYTYPDGDELHIVMVNEDGNWTFSDDGHTIMWLSYGDFNITDQRKNLLDRTLKTNGVSLTDGVLSIPIDTSTVDSIGLSLKSLIQTEIQVTDLLYTDKESVRDTFIDDLKSEFNTSSISGKCSYDRMIKDDGKTEHCADIYVDAKNPILIFGIHTALQCSRATVAMLALGKSSTKYMFMAVFDNNSQVPFRDSSAAINAAINTTIGLENAVESAKRLIRLQTDGQDPIEHI